MPVSVPVPVPVPVSVPVPLVVSPPVVGAAGVWTTPPPAGAAGVLTAGVRWAGGELGRPGVSESGLVTLSPERIRPAGPTPLSLASSSKTFAAALAASGPVSRSPSRFVAASSVSRSRSACCCCCCSSMLDRSPLLATPGTPRNATSVLPTVSSMKKEAISTPVVPRPAI